MRSVCVSHICLNHWKCIIFMCCDKLLVCFIITCILFRNLLLTIPWLEMCLLVFFSEGSTWTSGPARPTRPLWHPRVRRNRCEYPLRFTSRMLCYKDNHCTCNIALFCSIRVLPVEGAANENTPAQKELCFQQRERGLSEGSFCWVLGLCRSNVIHLSYSQR